MINDVCLNLCFIFEISFILVIIKIGNYCDKIKYGVWGYSYDLMLKRYIIYIEIIL